uniref:Uncharacterized protein n=1 Tax=Physcomitrium patens TaxID=3218 RepID=A0A2K1INR3_PHYPA|nr:hypothetical protein PHYPA_027241 [Physcomitrium patens]
MERKTIHILFRAKDRYLTQYRRILFCLEPLKALFCLNTTLLLSSESRDISNQLSLRRSIRSYASAADAKWSSD